MEDDPESRKQKKIVIGFLILFLATLILASSIGIAEGRRLSAYNINVGSEYVSSTGRCTCSLQTTYAFQTRTFRNYCPNCHRKGTIRYEVGKCSQNIEGMWFCSCCDMDFCLVHGKSHDNRGKYLIPASRPKKEISNPKIVNKAVSKSSSSSDKTKVDEERIRPRTLKDRIFRKEGTITIRNTVKDTSSPILTNIKIVEKGQVELKTVKDEIFSNENIERLRNYRSNYKLRL